MTHTGRKTLDPLSHKPPAPRPARGLCISSDVFPDVGELNCVLIAGGEEQKRSQRLGPVLQRSAWQLSIHYRPAVW